MRSNQEPEAGGERSIQRRFLTIPIKLFGSEEPNAPKTKDFEDLNVQVHEKYPKD